MTTTKRLAAYGMAAAAAIGGGVGGLALGLGLTGHQSGTVSTELAAASAATPAAPEAPQRGGGPDGARVDRLGVAATAIGITPDDLRTALQGGKTIAQVAADHKVDEQKVVDALVAAETTALDQAVKDGKLTQAQADQRKTGLAAHVKDEIEHADPGPRGPGGPGGHHGPPPGP
jgi:hypothetical protein